MEIWKGELVAKEIELNQMKEKYTNCLHNEKLKHQEIERLSASIFQMDILKRERIDVCTQTGTVYFLRSSSNRKKQALFRFAILVSLLRKESIV